MLRFAFVLLICASAFAHADDLPFVDLTFEEAKAFATSEERMLLVDFTATWCPPCKRMEKEVWPDARVVRWIEDNVVAIQVDVDEQKDVSRSMNVRAMPTMVMLQGSQEFDRTTGFLDAPDLLEWMDGASKLDGPYSAEDKLADMAAATDMHDPMERGRLADAYAEEGMNDEALRHYVWLWRESLAHSRSYSGVRLSFLIADISALAAIHEPTREAFEVFLDEAQVNIDAGDLSDWQDWKALCRLNGHRDRPLEWYDANRLPSGKLDRHLTSPLVLEDLHGMLVAKGRLRDAGTLVTFPGEIVRRAVMFRHVLSTFDEDGRDRASASFRSDMAVLHASLILAERGEDAELVASRVFESDDDAATYRAFITALLDAEHAHPVLDGWLDRLDEEGQKTASLRARLKSIESKKGL